MDEVARIREKIDIVSFISEYIPLKKAGRNFKCPCPFHNEKSPSFVVSPERQIWHCFGCAKGGDVFTFLMEYEKMEFVEALRTLAKRAGITLSEKGFDPGVSSKKDKIYSLNRLALEFYHYLLTKHAVGKNALSYLLDERKLNEGVINTFSLGFSPNEGTALCKFLIEKKKYSREDLIEAGLAIYTKGRLIDFFRGRIMFPLFDHRDNVVGFAGRVIKSQIDGSKYINSRDTLVYHKGELFFGLNIAKEEIKKQESIIIVEGELDVISCFMQGIKNVVAIKGTALTEKQALLVKRFSSKVSLCLDMDNAGFEATKRSLPILEKTGLTTTVVILPNGKDPDEAAKTNPNDLKKAVKNDIGIYDFMLSKFIEKYGKETVEGKKKITDEMLPLISNIENEIVKEHYVKKLSDEIGSSVGALSKQMEKIGKKEKEAIFIPKISKDKKSRKEIVEEYLMALIVQSENIKVYFEKMIKDLDKYEFENDSYRKIIEKMKQAPAFLPILPQELSSSFDIWMLLPLPKFVNEETYSLELDKVIDELKNIQQRKNVVKVWKNLT